MDMNFRFPEYLGPAVKGLLGHMETLDVSSMNVYSADPFIKARLSEWNENVEKQKQIATAVTQIWAKGRMSHLFI